MIQFFGKLKAKILTDWIKRYVRAAIEWSWRRKAYLAGLFVLFTAVFCWVSYTESMLSTRVTMSLNYEQAAEGQNPNETRFNISEMRQSEVMSNALKYAGLQDVYTPEELATCVSIRPTNRSGKSSAYVTTSYSITFTNRIGMKGVSVDDMLQLICKAYKDWFMSNCAENQSILQIRVPEPGSEEYLIEVDQLRIRAEQLSKYVRNRLKQVKNYTDTETGVSFSSIKQDIDNILSYDIENLQAYVLENGVAEDKANMLAILKYKQQQDQLKYDEYLAGYTVRNEGVRMYDEAMSAIVMIPTIDTTSEYYMSRTKTAMDELARLADEQLVEATSVDNTIRNNKYMIRKLSTVQPTAANFDKVDDMIAALCDKLNETAETLEKLDTQYLHYRTKDYMSVEGGRLSFKDRIHPSDSVIKGAAAVVVVILARTFFFMTKKGKRKEQRGTV